MADFNKREHSGGSHRPFKKGGFNRPTGRSFDQKESYDAECASCHKVCQVPFRPNGKKPVYCRDCFKPDDDRGPRPRFDERRPSSPRTHAPDTRIDDIKRKLDAMQETLEKLVAAHEASTRASALTKEVRKYVPAEKPARAPSKSAAKKPAKKQAKVAKKKS